MFKTHVMRLKPGQAIRQSLVHFVAEQQIECGFILSCVAGLQSATFRLAGATADQQAFMELVEPLELVSLVGTLSVRGCHLHIAVANRKGQVFGGHLKETVVGVTAEVVIGEDPSKRLDRVYDPETGFKELVVREP